MATMKTYSFTVTEEDWKTDDAGRKYLVHPITKRKVYFDSLQKDTVKFTPLKP